MEKVKKKREEEKRVVKKYLSLEPIKNEKTDVDTLSNAQYSPVYTRCCWIDGAPVKNNFWMISSLFVKCQYSRQ